MALTKEQRDALPDSDFAVPEKRALPIHDELHVGMAWKMVDRTKGLTDAERKSARGRIKKRAKELGMDTSEWNSMKAMRLEAMSLQVPEVEGHPNRVKFSGVLTRIDEPSDVPPGGANGRCVLIPKEVAEEALASLLGMGVDLTAGMDGHDAQRKIGVIDQANIEGNAIVISGFLYGKDFPAEVANIQAARQELGFSYECDAAFESMDADPLVVERCVFTGAAILFKKDAAYQSTSIAASAEEDEMSKELLEKMEQISAQLGALTTAVEAADAKAEKAIEAASVSAASVLDRVKPHSDAVRACASSMEAAGIGMHEKAGHVTALRHMADRMDAEAATGKIPHVYNDHSYLVDAGADKGGDKSKESAPSAEMTELKSRLGDLTVLVNDLKAGAFKDSEEPERKTLNPAVTALLAKAGIDAPPEGEKMTVQAVDKALEAAGITGPKAMAAKINMSQAGYL